MNKWTFCFFLILLFHKSFSQTCEINKTKLLNKFSIYPTKQINFKKAKAGEYNSETISIKFPNSTTEILKSDIIICPSYVPGGVTVKDIEVLSIEGLPKGIELKCETIDCFWKNAEYGCVNIEGKTNQKGNFPITVHVKGIANVLFMPIAVKCILEGYTLIVD